MTPDVIWTCALTVMAASIVFAVSAVVVSIGLTVAVTIYRKVTKGDANGRPDISGKDRR